MGITVEVYEKDNASKVADLTEDFARQFQYDTNDLHTHSVSVGVDNADAVAAMTMGRFLRYSIDGELAFTGVIETPNITTVDESEEIGEVAQFSGRGHWAELDAARLYPALGVTALPTSDTLYMNYAHPDFDDSGWGNAFARYPMRDGAHVIGDTPFGWLPYVPPEGWPWDAADEWIGSRGAVSTEPVGSSYFRKTFTVGSATDAAIFITADDRFDLWLDGVPLFINTLVYPELTWQKSFAAGLHISAGTHTIAVKVVNDDNGNPENVLNLVASVWTLVAGLPQTRLLGTDATWLCVDFPAQEPGMTAGKIVQLLFAAEQARTGSLVDDWTLSFDANVDSAGTPWPVLPGISYPISTTTLFAAIKQLTDAFVDMDASPGSKTLDLYVKGTHGLTQAVTLAASINVTQANYTVTAPITNCLLVRYKHGWIEVTNDTSITANGRHTGDLQLGDIIDVAAATATAQQYVDLYGDPQIATTLEYLPATEDEVPWAGLWQPFDTITGPDQSGTPVSLRSVRVQAADSSDLIDTDELAAVEIHAEFDSKLTDEVAQLQAQINRMADGSFGGRSNTASPAPDLDSGLSTGQVDSVDIPTASTDGGSVFAIAHGGKWNPDKPCRLTAVKAQLDVRGLTDTTIEIRKNGTAITNAVGGTSFTIPAGTWTYSDVLPPVNLEPTDSLQIFITAAGGLAQALTVQISAASSLVTTTGP